MRALILIFGFIISYSANGKNWHAPQNHTRTSHKKSVQDTSSSHADQSDKKKAGAVSNALNTVKEQFTRAKEALTNKPDTVARNPLTPKGKKKRADHTGGNNSKPPVKKEAPSKDDFAEELLVLKNPSPTGSRGGGETLGPV